jgi:hypothetical protein
MACFCSVTELLNMPILELFELASDISEAMKES